VAERYGDNIYQPDVSVEDGFIQMPNIHHGADKKAKDLKGKYVLVCEEFYYFSCLSPLEIPSDLRPNVPKVQTRYGMITEDASAFVNYVRLHTNQCK
jgi:archaellum component FlaC